MELYFYVMIFCFGVIIGSFLNVVIYRMHTGKSINGRSHCMTCGTHLSWYELFPIFSYLAQGAKCRHCTAYIPSRYLLVESVTGVAFVALWYLFHTTPILFVLYALLVAIFIVLCVYDIRHTIIPDELTLAVGGVALLLLMYAWYGGQSPVTLLYSVLSGLCASAFFGGLWYMSKGKWLGFGDVKLAFPLGVIVGIGGVFSMIVLSFWVGAALSLILLGLQRILKRGKPSLLFLPAPLTIKSEVPFAPFLISGFILAHFFHADIFTITSFFLPW